MGQQYRGSIRVPIRGSNVPEKALKSLLETPFFLRIRSLCCFPNFGWEFDPLRLHSNSPKNNQNWLFQRVSVNFVPMAC